MYDMQHVYGSRLFTCGPSCASSQIRGNGTYTWADGSVYVGEVSKGMRHGHGVFKAAGGFPVYEGGWRQGMRHGRGTLTYDTDGRVVFVVRQLSTQKHYR